MGSAAGAQVRALWWGSRVQGGQATEPGPRGGKSATQARPLCDPVCCPDLRSRGHGLAREAGTEGCRAGAVGQRGAWRGQAVPKSALQAEVGEGPSLQWEHRARSVEL